MGIKEYIKKKYIEQKKEWFDQRKFDEKLARARKKSYRESLLKERVRIAKTSAKVEADFILKRHTEKLKKKFKPLSKNYYGDITKGLPA